MTWQMNKEDLKAIELLYANGGRSVTDLVREIYGIELDADGKENNGDRLKKINRFKTHLKSMVDDGFLETSIAKTESSNHPVTVYSLADGIIRGKGVLLIFSEDGIDLTEIGKIIKIQKPDGKAAILPLTL
jgi:hypothetical protein